MEQTALRPKPMPGRDPGPGPACDDDRRPPGGHRRRRRLTTLLLGLLAATALLLAGVGLGTVGATVIGMSRLAELRQQAGAPERSSRREARPPRRGRRPARPRPPPRTAPPRPSAWRPWTTRGRAP